MFQSVHNPGLFSFKQFKLKVRQFANEMVTTAQIWGLQLPYVVAKTAQVNALHMEAQTKLWQQEATELARALSLDSAYARDLEPAAKAEAIVMEAPRRQSSTMSQSEEPEEVPDTDKVE